MDRKKILQLIREKLENNIHELTSSLDAQRSASDIDEGDTRDPEDFSQQSESRDKEMAMQIQLDAALTQLSKLDDFSGKSVNSAELGALLETDRNWFFMGISFSPISVEEKELYGVSPDSPAFGAMRGKSKGDKFMIGNNEHTILNIH